MIKFKEIFSNPIKRYGFAIVTLSFLIRVVPYLVTGSLTGVVDGFDEYVHYAGAMNIISGFAPYTDFLFLHTPLILVTYIPFAFMGKIFDDTVAIALARIFICLLGAVNTYLIYKIAVKLSCSGDVSRVGAATEKLSYFAGESRLNEVGAAAEKLSYSAGESPLNEVGAACEKSSYSAGVLCADSNRLNLGIILSTSIYACYTVFASVDRVGMIEPFLNFFLLLSVLFLIKLIKSDKSRYAFFMGVFASVMFFYKAWAVIDVFAFLLLFVFVFKNRKVLFYLLGVIATSLCVLIPVCICSSAEAFFNCIFTMQLSRPNEPTSIRGLLNEFNPFNGLNDYVLITVLLFLALVVAVGCFVYFGKRGKGKQGARRLGKDFSQGKEKKTVLSLFAVLAVLHITFFAFSSQIYWHYLSYMLLPAVLLLSCLLLNHIPNVKQSLSLLCVFMILSVGSLTSLSYSKYDYAAGIQRAENYLSAGLGVPSDKIYYFGPVDTLGYVNKISENAKNGYCTPIDLFGIKLSVYSEYSNDEQAMSETNINPGTFDKNEYSAKPKSKAYYETVEKYDELAAVASALVVSNSYVDFDVFGQYASAMKDFKIIYSDDNFSVYVRK